MSSFSGNRLAYEEFRSSGFLLAEGVFEPDTVSALARDSVEFLGSDTKKYRAIESIPGITHALTTTNSIDALSLLLGPNIAMTRNRHNHVALNQPGHANSGLHRDHADWSRGLLSAVVFLEDADEMNGATRIIPGSHNWFSPGYTVTDGYWLDDDVYRDYADRADEAVAIPVQSGDMLLFDGMVFHEAGENRSDSSRLSITLGFHAVDQLASSLPEHVVLISGENIYRGNDW